MHKLKAGEVTYDVRTVILLRDCDATLENMLRDPTTKGDALVTQFKTLEDVNKYEERRDEGYDPLCLILTDDRAMYPVKREHMAIAEKVVSAIDNLPLPPTKIN
jgi:hypothetical protein